MDFLENGVKIIFQEIDQAPMVEILKDNKVKRLKKPVEDFCRIEKKECTKRNKVKKRYPTIKNKFKIPRVISMWKNPNSEIISLEDRMSMHQRKSKGLKVNIERFMNFNKSLDYIEKECYEALDKNLE